MPIIWTNKHQQATHNQMPVQFGYDFSNENPPRYKVWARVTEGPDIHNEEIMNTADFNRVTQRMNEIHHKTCNDYSEWHNEDQRNKAYVREVEVIIAKIQTVRENGTQGAKELLASFLKG